MWFRPFGMPFSLAAQQLGIARNTFYMKIKKYGIDKKNF